MVVVVMVWGDVVMVVVDEDAVKRLVCGSRYQTARDAQAHRQRRGKSRKRHSTAKASMAFSSCMADRNQISLP